MGCNINFVEDIFMKKIRMSRELAYILGMVCMPFAVSFTIKANPFLNSTVKKDKHSQRKSAVHHNRSNRMDFSSVLFGAYVFDN